MTYLKLMMGAASALVLTACASAPVTEPVPETLVETPASEPAMKVDVHKGDFVEIQQFVTPGGVSVWLVSEPSIPIVSVEMAWKGGETSDPEGLEGLSDAVVYNMNEGAGDLDSLGFQTRMEELNMSFGCSTGNDWTSCSASMLKENAPEAMGLIATAFDAPRFDTGPFERFQRENLIGIKQRETSAGWLARKAMTDALYPDHPYARQTSVESITALTPELAREQMRKLMVKDRLLVTAVGAVTPEELAPMIDMALGGLPETSELPPVADITLPTPPADPIVVELPQPQSLVMFSAPGLERHDPDFFAAYVLNYTVGGGGFESRLMKTLRVDKGLTYGVSTGLSTSDHLDTWTGGGQTKNESAGEFLAGIHDELNQFVADGMTEEELSDAKAYLTGSYALGFDSNAKIADQIMSVRQQDLGIDYFDTRNANMNAVTLDDVNRVAKEYLSPDNFIYVVVGEPEGVE
ncbi:pitrilysin family protein [Hyphomonas chukchiensis]|uniref:M16 family metallopeptidase n=1 Tax=Hyphomonas chukchiensis TaxID=1280947 RepID=UPI0030F4F330